MWEGMSFVGQYFAAYFYGRTHVLSFDLILCIFTPQEEMYLTSLQTNASFIDYFMIALY